MPSRHLGNEQVTFLDFHELQAGGRGRQVPNHLGYKAEQEFCPFGVIEKGEFS